MNTMYVRKKTNTSARSLDTSNADETSSSPVAASSRPRFRKVIRNPLARSVNSQTSHDETSPPPTLKELHGDLQSLADNASPTTAGGGGMGGSVKRLLKGKKLVRVKRVPAKAITNGASVEAGEEQLPSDQRKVLRVKVKRKPKAPSSSDADSMAPAAAASSRRSSRRNRSDASVGTGVFSKAKSWFSFGGMKLGSGGKDFLLDDDEEDEDDLDRMTQANDGDDFGTEYDELTMDVRTNTPEDATTQKDEASQLPTAAITATTSASDTPQQPASPSRVPSHNNSSAGTSPHASPTKSKVGAAKSPNTAKSNKTAGSMRSKRTVASRGPGGSSCPTREIICHPAAPKKQPLTGVALRRLQIQEQWLSKGCNYKPNEFLMATMNQNDHDDVTQDVSEISYEEPILLVMGPDAPEDQEVSFWTQTCNQYQSSATFGPQHGRTAEALLNQGIAQLNSRQTSQAVDSFLEAVGLLQEKYGEQSLAVARGMHLLGSAFFLEGQLPTAVEATRKGFEIRKQVLGPFHTDTVDTFSNLAMIYLKMSKLLEAARIFNEVLKIRKAIYDEFHPSVAFPARSLGCVYAKRRDMDRASKSYAHALRCFQLHGMTTERMDTESEMLRFGLHAPVEDSPDEDRLEI